MAAWQMCLVRLKATLASKMSVPGDEKEPIEAMLRSLRAMTLVSGPAQREAIARLRPHVEKALRALEGVARNGALSSEEREQLERLRSLRRAIEDLQ